MTAIERLQQVGPWLLGLTFFVLAGLSIQLSTVQLSTVTFVYGSAQVLDGGRAAFRVVIYDPLLNRTRESVGGSWSLSSATTVQNSGTLQGYGEFIITTEIPVDATELTLDIHVNDSVLGTTAVSIPLRSNSHTEETPGAATLTTKHQAWAINGSGDALLAKLYPLNAFEIVRGLPAPVVVELTEENGQPISGAEIKLANCMSTSDREGRVLCQNVFTRSPSLQLAVKRQDQTFSAEFETSGHSQSLTMGTSDELNLLELRTLPFKDIIHIDHWLGPYLIHAMDIPRQREVYEWVPKWRSGKATQHIVAYRRILNPNSTATFFPTSAGFQRRSVQAILDNLGDFHQSLGERVIPLLGSNKVQNEAMVVNLQTHLKSRVAQLMLLLGTAVVGWIITYGYRAHRRRKERLREWMLDAEDDEFDPEVMKLGEANHKVDIALGLAVLISFLFGLYIMLTELLRWGWELI